MKGRKVWRKVIRMEMHNRLWPPRWMMGKLCEVTVRVVRRKPARSRRAR